MSWLSALSPKTAAPPTTTTAAPTVSQPANSLAAAQSKGGGGNALAASLLSSSSPTVAPATCTAAPKGSWLTQGLDWLGDGVEKMSTPRETENAIDEHREATSQGIDVQQAKDTAAVDAFAGSTDEKIDKTTAGWGGWLADHGLETVGAAVTGVGDFAGDVTEGAISGGNALVQGSQDVMQGATFGLPSMIHDGKSWIDDKWSAMEDFGTNLGDGIEEKVGGAWQAQKDTRNQIAAQQAEGTEAGFANLGAKVDGALDGGAAYLDKLGEGKPGIVDKGLDAMAWLLDKGGDAAEGTANGMGTVGSTAIKVENWYEEQKDQVVQALVGDFAWGAIRGGTELIEDVAEIAVNPYGGAENLQNAAESVLGVAELSSQIRDGFHYDGGSPTEEGEELVQSVKDVGLVLDELTGNDFTEGRITEGVVSLLSNFLPWGWSAAAGKLNKIDKLSDIANLKKLETIGGVVDDTTALQSVVGAGEAVEDKNETCTP